MLSGLDLKMISQKHASFIVLLDFPEQKEFYLTTNGRALRPTLVASSARVALQKCPPTKTTPENGTFECEDDKSIRTSQN